MHKVVGNDSVIASHADMHVMLLLYADCTYAGVEMMECHSSLAPSVGRLGPLNQKLLLCQCKQCLVVSQTRMVATH